MTNPSRRDLLTKTATIAAIGAATAYAYPTFATQLIRQPDEPNSSPPPSTDDIALDKEQITTNTILEAEKLAGISFTLAEREQILKTIEEQRSVLAARISQGMLPNQVPPATIFQALPPNSKPQRATLSGNPWENLPSPGRCPTDDMSLAFAPVWKLGQWLKRREVTSTRLTTLALTRLEQYDPTLHCVIQLTKERAMQQAKRADQELDARQWRGPLHGVPWGAKDIIDTAGISTTWGAAAYKDRVPNKDAYVVNRLEEAGAVLVAKLALGALAYGDIWFGGTCKNPFDPEQGSSGSSAGSASATAAGLVPFTLGTETYGSIVSRCMRCGTTGLRPTFGRVARNGVMALCWTLDKIGPICRSVLDTALVLHAINGSDPLDPSSVDQPFTFDASQSAKGLRVGYNQEWFKGESAQFDRAALRAVEKAGATLVEIELPEINSTPLLIPLFVEAAAAFEDLTRSNLDDQLSWQDDDAWPNSFRQAWFIPAIELVQADRIRRQTMELMHKRMHDNIDAILCPAFGNLLLITNATGHPSLVLRTGMRDDGHPVGTTLIGRLFDEGTLCRLGMAIESVLDVADIRPDLTS